MERLGELGFGMREPPVPRIQQIWRPDEFVISVDPRIDLPNLLRAECFWAIRRAMESAGIFWIVGDAPKECGSGYTKR